MNQVTNPFTPEQVAEMEKYQRAGEFHPFTCGNRGDGKHGDIDGDTGILVPTVRGWICRYCDYTQGWAHPFMTGEK
jgi:hypothetical protein